MEYRLNKIDTDLRQRINELTQEGKVHTGEKIQVSKDKDKEREKEDRQQKEKERSKNLNKSERYNLKRKLVVEAIKVDNIEVEAFKEEDKATTIEKGSIIDIRR